MTVFEQQNLKIYYEDIWEQVKQLIKDDAIFEEVVFNSLFGDTKLLEINEEEAIISAFLFSQSLLEQHSAMISEKLFQVTHRHLKCIFMKEEKYMELRSSQISDDLSIFQDNINPDYTFDNFVLGSSNKEAQSSSLLLAHDPNHFFFNPLFIYGDSGLGKTHLMHAIGNYIKKHSPDLKVLYISASDFIDRFVDANKSKSLNEFKREMNSLDVLMVDDIQMLAGKEKTNELFFQIYNTLVNNRKHIILTSDKPPKELNDIEERLISRFASGLTVTISSPEFETRLNILKMKIKNNRNYDDMHFDEDSLSYIASNCDSDVRALEGSLNRLMYCSINYGDGCDITYNFTVEALKDIIKPSTMNSHGITPSLIISTVANYYGLSKQQLTSKSSRTKNIATARHISIFLCRELLDLPYKKIGSEFGKLDHSTVMSAYNKISKLYATNDEYKQLINQLKGKLQ